MWTYAVVITNFINTWSYSTDMQILITFINIWNIKVMLSTNFISFPLWNVTGKQRYGETISIISWSRQVPYFLEHKMILYIRWLPSQSQFSGTYLHGICLTLCVIIKWPQYFRWWLRTNLSSYKWVNTVIGTE